MTYQVTINELSEIFYETYFAHTNSSDIPHDHLLLPPALGQGGYNIIKISNTLVGELKFLSNRDIELTEHPFEDTYFITFCMHGSITFDMFGSNSKHFAFESGNTYLGYAQKFDSYKTFFKDRLNIHALTIFLTQEQLINYAINFDNPLLVNAICNAQQSQLFSQIKISQRQMHIASQFFDSPYHGDMQYLHMEYTSSELMFSSLTELCSKKPFIINLTERDKEQLFEARRILTSNLSNPPTISELARKVALNEDKLKKGFRYLFNNTVFKTLTAYRMRQAMQQLKRNDMSISEIAHNAGYENVSSFIKVFRQQYGNTPGNMRKEKKYYI